MRQSEIIPLRPDQIAEAAALERLCFADPWPEQAFASELENPLSLWLAAVQGGQLIGYVGAQSVLGEADMMNLAVHPDFRRQGVGQALVQTLIEQLHARQVYRLSLEVRVSNAGAIALYERLGFVPIGRRPRYYFHPTEDAWIYGKEWTL